MVSLVEFSTHGATGRYLGSLQPLKASHPVVLSNATMARILSGIQVGIIPSDASGETKGIKPTPLFSSSEVGALATTIAGALKQAGPSQYVTFQVGTDPETTDGALYVDGPAINIILNHYHSVVRRRDESLSIYALSFTPDSAQLPASHKVNWIEETAGNPRLAVSYRHLAVPDPPQQSPPDTAATPHGSQPAIQDMKATMEKQGQELDAMKAELEALKKQLKQPAPASRTAP